MEVTREGSNNSHQTSYLIELNRAERRCSPFMSLTSVGTVISNLCKIITFDELLSCDSFLLNLKHYAPSGCGQDF